MIEQLSKWKQESSQLRTQYEARWSKNIKLSKGIWTADTKEVSKITRQRKVFFRKIWATVWRLVASWYNAFLRDPDTFKIEGRGYGDGHKAQILQFMTEYRRDIMMRSEGLFKKFIWAFLDIGNLGLCTGKLCWRYDDRHDGPEFILYPPEQVSLDMTAETEDQMRYVGFENYMTKDQMEEMGYSNIDKIKEMAIPSNQVRDVRYSGSTDPLQNPGNKEYPEPGRYIENGDTKPASSYICNEWFWWEKGEIKHGVWAVGDDDDNGLVWLKKVEVSPYGDELPLIKGDCLLEAHKLIGEGLPEPLEGPQESFNFNLNMRKENVALALNSGAIVNRYGNVDIQSLVNSRPGAVTMADDTKAVEYKKYPDVTQSSYIEANSDESMMEEMSGVTRGKQGLEGNVKATVARINLSEGNAKIELFTAIVAETFMRSFHYKLAKYIQMFETDERVFYVANDKFKKENGVLNPDIYDLEFDADCIVTVGNVSRDLEIQQAVLAFDRSVQSNQAIMQLAQIGAVPPEGVRMIDTTQFMEKILRKLGFKDTKDMFFTINQPQTQEGGQGSAPTPKNMDFENLMQSGGLGGI